MADRDGPKCGGKRHGRAETCELPAGWGTQHVGTGRCRKHFGNAPNVIKAAANQSAQEQARAELAKLGVDVKPVTNPIGCLAELAGEQRQWQQFCRDRVKSLDPDDMRFVGNLRGEQQRAEINMYESSVDQSARILIALSKAYTEEQQARITERQRRAMAQAMGATVQRLGLDSDVQRLAVRILAEEVRRVGALDDADMDALPPVSAIVIRGQHAIVAGEPVT